MNADTIAAIWAGFTIIMCVVVIIVDTIWNKPRGK